MAVAVVVVAAVSCTGGAAGGDRRELGRWLALGDSYSSGEGVLGAVGPCQRSPAAYAPVAARDLADVELVAVACTGGRIRDLDGQIAEGLAALGGNRPDLVTLTIGGNDVGFSTVLVRCISSGIGPCAIDQPGISAGIDRLRGDLVSTYRRLRLDVLSPEGVLVVIGYPHLFADPDDWPAAEGRRCDGFGRPDAEVLRSLAEELNAAVAAAVAEAGAEFLAVAPLFEGHDRCGPDEPWLHGISAGVRERTFRVQSSFHPNSAGHAAVADLLVERLQALFAG
ncbi:MAG: SGNH/GDSL hydrolase family protein [Acidimicrobiia bacterium]